MPAQGTVYFLEYNARLQFGHSPGCAPYRVLNDRLLRDWHIPCGCVVSQHVAFGQRKPFAALACAQSRRSK